jgi:hypothetical protein
MVVLGSTYSAEASESKLGAAWQSQKTAPRTRARKPEVFTRGFAVQMQFDFVVQSWTIARSWLVLASEARDRK